MTDAEKLALLLSYYVDFGGPREIELTTGQKHNVRADLYESEAFTQPMVKHTLVNLGKRAGGIV